MNKIDFKCQFCSYMDSYITGKEDSPPLTKLYYCSRGHWEEEDIAVDKSNFNQCKDFREKINNGHKN